MQQAATTGSDQRSVLQVVRRGLRQLSRAPEIGILLALVITFVLFGAINGAMFTRLNALVTIRTVSYVGIVAVGMTYLLTVREIDLSVGTVSALAAVACAWVMTKGQMPIGMGILAGLLVGVAAGLVNGVLTVKLGVPSIVATLGMLYAARGLAYVVTEGGSPLYPLPDAVGRFGTATPLGLAWASVAFAVLVVAGHLLLRRTTLGAMVVATGGNREAARIAGVPVDRVKIVCFVLTSVLAAAAGMLVMARIKTGDIKIGDGWELLVITAVLVGGASLGGGIGTVLGAALGIIFLQVVRTGLVIVGVSPFLQNAAVGLLLLMACTIDLLRRGRKRD